MRELGLVAIEFAGGSRVFKVEGRKLMSVNMVCRWTHVAEAVSEHAV